MTENIYLYHNTPLQVNIEFKRLMIHDLWNKKQQVNELKEIKFENIC